MYRLTIYAIIFAILCSLIIAGDPCRFVHNEKGVIDISTLARKDGKPAFPDETPTGPGSNYQYSYNPCKPFSEGETCKDVAVCQVSKDKQFTFILGKHDSATWDAGTGPGSNPTLSYKFDVKQVQVELLCNDKDTPELEALGEAPPNSYKFRLNSKCACWNGCKSAGGGGLPGGAIFIIILLALAAVYFIGFTIYYRFAQHRTGVDMIPHRTFWVSLPGYARGGVTHIVRRVTGKGGAPYEAV